MTMLDATTAALSADARAFVLLKSRRRLDLLNPDPQAWTDGDLAAGLSCTMRWGGASQWAHPLSVAQHSLAVLAIREGEGPLTAQEGLRELLHDATEFMLGWDCVAPLKAQLGAPFRQLEARLQAAIDARYQLLPGTAEAYAKHKRADRLAAAVEALGIEIPPLLDDPLPRNGFARWEPWPPRAAQDLFMQRFRELAHASRLQPPSRTPCFGRAASHPATPI
jgi:5'-nucleotidase